MNERDYVLDYLSSPVPLVSFLCKEEGQTELPVNQDILEVLLVSSNRNSLGEIKVIQGFDLIETSRKIQEGLNRQFKPILCEEGVSGSYFMRDQNGMQTAIFKCIDEEPFAPNNPKGYLNQFGEDSFRTGVKSGEISVREMAAYYLDNSGVHGVPQTSMV